MLKPYYVITAEDQDTHESVALPFEFETYGEAEDALAKLSHEFTARGMDFNGSSGVYFRVTAASDSVGFFGAIGESWNRPTGHEVFEAMLAAFVVLCVCGFVLAVWGLIETIL